MLDKAQIKSEAGEQALINSNLLGYDKILRQMIQICRHPFGIIVPVVI